VQTEISVTWAWADRPQNAVRGTILDISSSGARLVASECPQVGETLKITLNVPDPELELVASARVIRIADLSRPHHCIWAVAFEDLSLDGQARLARFVFCEAARRRGLVPGNGDVAERPALRPVEDLKVRPSQGWYS